MGISVRDHVARAVRGTTNVLCNGGVSLPGHRTALQRSNFRDVIMTSSSTLIKLSRFCWQCSCMSIRKLLFSYEISIAAPRILRFSFPKSHDSWTCLNNPPKEEVHNIYPGSFHFPKRDLYLMIIRYLAWTGLAFELNTTPVYTQTLDDFGNCI